MRNPFLYVSLTLTGIIIYLILAKPKRETVLDPHEQQIVDNDLKIADLAQSNRGLVEQLKKDSLAHVKKESVSNAIIERLSKKVSISRPVVMQQVDSLPIVKAFIQDQDSIIAEQKILLMTDGKRILQLEVGIQKVSRNFEKQIILLNDLKKSKRANRLLKAVAVVLGFGGLVLGSQL